jgi:hypothetical protein
MSGISYLNTAPASGDLEETLLGKILQVLNAGGGGSGDGVTSVLLTGFAEGAGVVTSADTILTAFNKTAGVTNNLLNFRDDANHTDAIIYRNSGTTEALRVDGATGFVQISGATFRFFSTATTDQITFLASNSKSTGAFLEVYGQNHVSGVGGATISIHNGGQFRVRSAPQNDTTSVIRFSVDATTGVSSFLPTIAPAAGGSTGIGLLVSSTANFGIFWGTGAPTLSAAQGSLYLRRDGTGVNDRAYINTNGTTGWTALVTVA